MATRSNSNIVSNLLKDKEWINDCFMLPRTNNKSGAKIDENTLKWMYYTTADLKYTNTSLGGNFTVNNPPQYTVFADPPTGRLMTANSKKAIESGMTQGMGQYYSEAIDDHAQRVTLRFGVPEYKGLVTFFTGFYNAGAALMGNEGRVGAGLFYLAGRIIGGVVALPLSIVMVLSKMARFAFNRPSTKYYWMKPTMPLYWNRVNKVCNRVAAEMGLVPDVAITENQDDPLKELDLMEPSSNGGMESAAYDMAKEFMPELFNDTGGIDIYRVVNKTARMANHAREQLLVAGEGSTKMESFAESVRKHMQSVNISNEVIQGKPLHEYLKSYHESVLGGTEITGADGQVMDITRRNTVLDRLKKISDVDTAAAAAGTVAPTDGAFLGQEVNTDTTGTATTPTTATTPSTAAVAPATLTNNLTNTMGANNTTTITPPKPADTPAATVTTPAATAPPVAGATPVVDPNATPATGEGEEAAAEGGGGESAREAALGEAPDDDEARALMKEYAEQDNLIVSVLRTGTDNVLELALGWSSNQKGQFQEYVDSTMDRGSDWVSFKVDANQTESESFNNTFGESELQSSVNGISNTVRSAAFNFANFKTGFGLIDGPIAAVKDMIYGAMDSFQISGLLALAGTGLVDIPQRYEESSASVFTSTTYTMQLRCAYGDPLSIYLNLYVPFLCLMAGALPISHGNQSYGAPMLCELFQRGRSTIRLGMIESLSVTRGTGTVGWNEDGLPLGLDVTFSVANLSNILHMPIDTGLQNMMPWNALIADDNLYSDYIAALSNLTIADQTNPWKKHALKKRAWRTDIDTYFNSARIGNAFSSGSLSRLMSHTLRQPPGVTL